MKITGRAGRAARVTSGMGGGGAAAFRGGGASLWQARDVASRAERRRTARRMAGWGRAYQVPVRVPGPRPAIHRRGVDIREVWIQNQSVQQTGFLKEAEMTTRDVERIRFVTQHFNDLQGLRLLVPLGLIVLSVGGTTYFDNRPLVILRAGLFLAGALLMLGARRYYRDRFGEVESETAYEPGELHSLSIYSPAGPISRLQGFQEVTPRVRFLLMTLGLAFVVFFVLQSIVPTVAVEVDESLVRPPWATLDSVL